MEGATLWFEGYQTPYLKSEEGRPAVKDRVAVAGQAELTAWSQDFDNDSNERNFSGTQSEDGYNLNGSWGYDRDNLDWKPVSMLVQMLVDSVSKGGNLLLNVGPTGRGEFDPRAQETLRGIGAWMRQHSRSIYGCTQAPAEFPTPQDCRLTYNPATRVLTIGEVGSAGFHDIGGKYIIVHTGLVQADRAVKRAYSLMPVAAGGGSAEIAAEPMRKAKAVNGI